MLADFVFGFPNRGVRPFGMLVKQIGQSTCGAPNDGLSGQG
jgi:hypothetical protein